MNRTRKGLWIVVDGIDGCGKSTLTHNLSMAYRKGEEVQNVIHTREPGGSSIGKEIRELLRHPLDSRTELYLFSADRRMHVAEVIKPALDQDKTVIQDRGWSSTFVYQGYVKHLGYEDILQTTLEATGNYFPDLTIILDCDVLTANARMKGFPRPDGIVRFDDATLEVKELQRQGYLYFAQEFKNSVVVIEAGDSPETVFVNALEAINNFLEERKPE